MFYEAIVEVVIFMFFSMLYIPPTKEPKKKYTVLNKK